MSLKNNNNNNNNNNKAKKWALELRHYVKSLPNVYAAGDRSGVN